MSKKITDKKKNAPSSEMVEPTARGGDKEKERSKDTRMATREREIKPPRRESKESPGVLTRLLRTRVVRFFREAYHELRYKVTWPTFEEARNMTIVVILLSTAVGLLLTAADLGLFQVFRLVIGSK